MKIFLFLIVSARRICFFLLLVSNGHCVCVDWAHSPNDRIHVVSDCFFRFLRINFKLLIHTQNIQIMKIENQTINGGVQTFTESVFSLERKLSQKEQEVILSNLYGFFFSEGVLLTDDGEEFYGYDKNDKYDLSTLGGILQYHFDRGVSRGELTIQSKMKSLLNL